MRRIVLFMVLIFISSSIPVMAQTDFYYYNGNKIPLTLNENKVCINIPKECDKTCERILANVTVLDKISDETFVMFIISRSDFEKLTSQDFWEEDAKSVILTSSYFIEHNREVYETPYFYVKLKKEEDKDLLVSYAEKYRLKIVRNSPLMPLWYTLALTLDSKKSTLEIVNEIYESGDFVASEPALAGSTFLYSTIRNVSPATTEKSSEIYDLQGRKLTSKPSSGIYIHRGQKKLAGSR